MTAPRSPDRSRQSDRNREFRDVLAHTYGPVVNDGIVYDPLQDDHDRYVEFVEAIGTYLAE